MRRYLKLLWIQLRSSMLLALQYRWDFLVDGAISLFYAVTAVCTHDGATCVTQSNQIYCPRHGAKFTYNGDIISGPVITGLVHYAMCNMSNGNLGVITSMTVSKSTRIAG